MSSGGTEAGVPNPGHLKLKVQSRPCVCTNQDAGFDIVTMRELTLPEHKQVLPICSCGLSKPLECELSTRLRYGCETIEKEAELEARFQTEVVTRAENQECKLL